MKTKYIIIKSFGITELRYGQMVMDAGDCWLKSKFEAACGFEIVNDISKIALFWKWWVNQWEIRDREFIRLTNVALIGEELEGNCRTAAIQVYNEIHNPYFIKVLPNVWLQAEINNLLIMEIEKSEVLIKQLK